MYVTTDGVSWAEQDAGIHAVPAESVVADPRTAGTLYIAALGEVQKTVDDGTVWTRSFPPRARSRRSRSARAGVRST